MEGPARCLACRDLDKDNKASNEDLTGGMDRVTWPDKAHAPDTPTNPIDLAIRIITVFKDLT